MHERPAPGETIDLGPLADSPDELFVFDRGGTIVAANAVACRHLGYAPEELVGRSVWQVSARQTAAGFARVVAALETEGPQVLSGHNRRRDGSTYPVKARMWVAPFGGEPHVFSLLWDARSEQPLIEERDQLISLIENSSEMIAVAGPDGVCAYMNSAGLEMLGLERLEDVAGRPLVELHPESQRKRVEGEVLPAIRHGRWRGELAFRNFRDGSRTPCWVNAFAVKPSRSGEVIGLALVAHDISERKAAERHREKLLALNEVSRNVVTSLLEEDDLNQAVRTILSGVGRILGVQASYLYRFRKGKTRLHRTHGWSAEGGALAVGAEPEPSEGYAWALDPLLRGDPVRIDSARDRGGIPREGSTLLQPSVRALLLVPVRIQGRLESFFAFVDRRPREWGDEEVATLQIIVDAFARAVERRGVERERARIAHDLERAVEREKEANRYKSEFLANMSHELRTPMNSIVGYAELLGRPKADPKKQEVWLANIRRSTGYLLSLINDVLDLSKIEAGQMRLEPEACHVTDVLASVEELLRGQAEEKLLDFRVQWEPDVPAVLQTDPVRLKQILVNLVGNAIKFTQKGSVTVRVAAERPEQASEGEGWLAVSVADTGIGIGREDLERLFRPFAQVHRGRAGRFRGTGLGLDISRHLARLLGGEIEVESELGRGSTFTAKIPLRGASRETVAPHTRAVHGTPAAAHPDLTGRRALVVDDSPENRDVLTFLLAESGCGVETAENGAIGVARAVEAARSGRPYDVVLMDMNMPVLDGYEATRQIASAGVESPVIALTALALSGDQERCLQAGCVDYVSKPVVPSSFFGTILRHLSRSEGADPGAGGVSGASAPEGGPSSDAAGIEVAEAISHDAWSLADNPRFRPLVERYVASFPRLVDELREHHRAGRLEELRTRVHRLRGTAANYGFPEVSRAAGACEDEIRASADPSRVQAALAELENLLLSAGG